MITSLSEFKSVCDEERFQRTVAMAMDWLDTNSVPVVHIKAPWFGGVHIQATRDQLVAYRSSMAAAQTEDDDD